MNTKKYVGCEKESIVVVVVVFVRRGEGRKNNNEYQEQEELAVGEECTGRVEAISEEGRVYTKEKKGGKPGEGIGDTRSW